MDIAAYSTQSDSMLHCERNLIDKLASSRSNNRGTDNLIRRSGINDHFT
jgi:hypothetical protein